MADKKFSELSAAGTLAGTELVAITQSGATVRTTTGAIANSATTLTGTTINDGQLNSAVMTAPQINDTTADHQYIVAVSELADDRTVTLPLLTDNDEFVFKSHAQTLTNKTLSNCGLITPTAGIAAAGGFTISARGLHTGNVTVTQTTDGNDTTPSVTETYICAVNVPYNCTINGVALFNGSVAAGNITVRLADSDGVPVGVASASTAMVGTDAFQLIPLAAAYEAVGPATYLVLVQFDNTSARFNSHILGAFGASKKTGETYGTFTNVTPPTTFTTAVGPIASLY